MRATCASCGKKDTLVWSEVKPHPYICHACGDKGNVYTLGYVDEGYRGSADVDITPTEKAITRYRKKSGKTHRLTPNVVDRYGLKAEEYISSQGNIYKSLTLSDEQGRAMKRLVGDKWIAMSKKDMPPGEWLGCCNVDWSDDDIYITAGEWDMFALYEHAGINSISPAYGEMHRQDWRSKLGELEIFENKNVIILYDNDNAGRKGSKHLASAIARHVKTESIKVVDLAEVGVKGGGDLDDFFSLGGQAERLMQVIADTQPFDSSVMQLDSSFFSSIEQRVIPCPDFPDASVSPEVLDILWRAAIKPKVKRLSILMRLAEEEVGDNFKAAKAQVKMYQDEIDALNSLGQEIIIDNIIRDKHIKRYSPIGSGDGWVSYYYRDGVYTRLLEEDLDQMVEDVIRLTQPPDRREKLVSIRRATKQDIKVAISLLPMSRFEDDEEIKHINLRNGLYHIETGKLVDHSPDILSRYQLSSSVNEGVDPVNFKSAIQKWFETEDERKEFLKFCYYTISGIRANHICAVFRGDGGNGKGEAAKVLQDLIGSERTTGLRMEHLKNDVLLSSLSTSLLNISDEISKKGIIPDGQMKAVTGESLVVANPKYRDQYSFRSKAQWVIISNHPLSTTDISDGMMRRFKFFNFRYLPEAEREAGFYENKLRPEISGIINYILTEGRRLYEAAGFVKLDTDRKMKEEIERRNSVSGYILDLIDQLQSHEQENKEDYRIFEPHAFKRGKLSDQVVQYIDPLKHYVEYLKYCKSNNNKEVTLENFKSDLRSFIMRRLRGGELDKLNLRLSSMQVYLPDIRVSKDGSESISMGVIKMKTRRVIALTRINKFGDIIPVGADPFWVGD